MCTPRQVQVFVPSLFMQAHDRLDVAKETGTWTVHVVSRIYVRVGNISSWSLPSPVFPAGRPGGRLSARNPSYIFSRLHSTSSLGIASDFFRPTTIRNHVYSVTSSLVQSYTLSLAPIFEAGSRRSYNARYPRLPYPFISQQYNPCR